MSKTDFIEMPGVGPVRTRALGAYDTGVSEYIKDKDSWKVLGDGVVTSTPANLRELTTHLGYSLLSVGDICTVANLARSDQSSPLRELFKIPEDEGSRMNVLAEIVTPVEGGIRVSTGPDYEKRPAAYSGPDSGIIAFPPKGAITDSLHGFLFDETHLGKTGLPEIWQDGAKGFRFIYNERKREGEPMALVADMDGLESYIGFSLKEPHQDANTEFGEDFVAFPKILE